MLAELAFDLAGPGYELEAEAVVDHREPAGGEVETLAVDARDLITGGRLQVRQTGLGGEARPDRIQFAPPQRGEEVALQDDPLALAATEALVGEKVMGTLSPPVAPRAHTEAIAMQ